VQSLSRQTTKDVEVIVVDNSGSGLVRKNATAPGARVIENARNAGFGGAINQGLRVTSAPYVATLNDDAVASPQWVASLLAALERRPDAGMAASQVRFFGEMRLDSAGMLIARDGSSKQRGHDRAPEDFPVFEEALMPSGSAAMYRRTMLEEIGGFDDDFFLYCEDTDLGLRARWAGWKCLYVPEAVVEHHYSHSAGRASGLKAYYVERNRLFVLVKNFPGRMLLAAPFITAARYWWHAWFLLRGRGQAARYRAAGNAGPRLAWYIVKAHAALLANLGRLLRQRREIRSRARITPAIFRHLALGQGISARRVAEL
jgi:GT2 family glycosyltransferase